MPRSRIDLEAVIDAAIDLIDSDGLEALTLSNVAEALSVRPSALYTHVDNPGHLHYVVAVAATTNLTSSIRNAAIGVAGRDAVVSVAQAYHAFAERHPGQYAATLSPPSTGDQRLAEACSSLLDVLVLVLRGLGMTPDQAADAALSMRSTLHGFLALNHATGSDDGAQRLDPLLDLLLHGLVPRRSE